MRNMRHLNRKMLERIYLFIKIFYFFREREREGKREEEKHQSVASHTCPNQGLGLQPSHVLRLRIQPETFLFLEKHLIH